MNRWIWKAHLKDGTTIAQGEMNPSSNREWSTDHIEPAAIKALTLEPINSTAPQVVLQIREGETFRRFWRQYMSAMGGGVEETCWVLLLEKNGVGVYTFLKADGTIVISTDPEASEFTL